MSSYEEKINDVMSCKLELNLDKKKSLQQNLDTLHDQLMQKNISNHKTISKFIFSHSGRVFKRFSSKRQLKVPTKKLI
jgi:glutathione peroxidase-family protein